MSITTISNLLFRKNAVWGQPLLERKEITRNYSLGTSLNMLSRMKSSNTKKHSGRICTLFQYNYYFISLLHCRHTSKKSNVLKYAPKKTKIGFNKTKTKWCIAESSHNVVFVFKLKLTPHIIQ